MKKKTTDFSDRMKAYEHVTDISLRIAIFNS